jgi:hypothetical protein
MRYKFTNKVRLFESPPLLDFQFSQRHNAHKFALCSFSLTKKFTHKDMIKMSCVLILGS